MASWCLCNDMTASSSATCQSYLDLHARRMNIYLWIALLILVSRMCIKQVVLFMRPYLRFKDKSEESAGIMTHLFVNYTMISVLIALSVNPFLSRCKPTSSGLPWEISFPRWCKSPP